MIGVRVAEKWVGKFISVPSADTGFHLFAGETTYNFNLSRIL